MAKTSESLTPVASADGTPLPPNHVPELLAAELLPRLDMEDYVPTVGPWLKHSSNAVLASVGLGLLFIAICPYHVVVRGQGSMRAAGEQVLVNAPFSGRVVGIAVRTNQAVQAGQSLFSLDSREFEGEAQQLGKSSSALADQEQALQGESVSREARARLDVQKSEAALSFAQSEFRRYLTLARQGAASASLYEAKLSQLQEAEVDLQKAEKAMDGVRLQARQRAAELRREKAGVEQSSAQTSRNLQNTTVRAPVSGVLFQLLVRSPQQTVAAGEQLATITPSTAERLAKVTVTSEEVETVRAGQLADLRITGCPYPDFGTLPAEVVAVSPEALPDSKLYEVTLKPRRNYLTSRVRRCEVMIGMPLQADIRTREETILGFILRKTRLFVGT